MPNVMKLIFLILLMQLSLISSAQYVTAKDPIVITINKDSFSFKKDEKIYCNLPIDRSNKQIVMLLLPILGTNSYATLYKLQDYERNKKNPEVLEYLRKRTDSKSIPDGQPLTLNLTSLEDGEYIAIYHTDIVFAPIKVILSTKR